MTTSATTDCERLKLRAAGMEPKMGRRPRPNGICKRGHDTKLPENQYLRGGRIDCAVCDKITRDARKVAV